MSSVPVEIEQLRQAIDKVDDEIVDLLAKRSQLVVEISKQKARLGLPVVQANRFNEILVRTQARAEQRGVSAELISDIFEAIHSKSVMQQKKERKI